LRILHLLASPVFSGPAENVVGLSLQQRALGHEVSVAVDRKRNEVTSEELLAPRLSALELLDDGGLELSVKSSPWAIWRDVKRLRERTFDVVHCHFSHDHWLVHWAKLKNAAVVRSIHAQRSIRGLLPDAGGWTLPRAEDAIYWKRGAVMVLPPFVGEAFRPPESRARLREELGLWGQPLIGMVSTFQATRRHPLALEAFMLLLKQLPQAQLVLVGDGVTRDEVCARVEQMGLSQQVLFAGYRAGEEFVRWLQALDEVWILGLGNDFSGRAAAQARACGVRVVAVREGALPEHADVVVALEAEAIARASLGGQRRAVEPSSSEAVARRVLELYAQARGAR
jgi:glycosyltransferase involved in cell wall biosynthesis